jgi:hypothetical protein
MLAGKMPVQPTTVLLLQEMLQVTLTLEVTPPRSHSLAV